jgi:hypothetical protein
MKGNKVMELTDKLFFFIIGTFFGLWLGAVVLVAIKDLKK